MISKRIATDIKEVKKKTLESLWKMLKKAAFSFKSLDFEVCKKFTSRTTYEICIINNKDKTRKILGVGIGIGVKDDQEILLELSKTFNIETILECTIDCGYLKKCYANTDTDTNSEIDFNVFQEANITCSQNMGRKNPEEFKIDLKKYSGELDGFFDQYQFRNSDNLSTLKITLPLDIKYIVEKYSLTFALILAFIMGSHKRLGNMSLISLLDSDILSFIVFNYLP
jgi:hypothetical protein